MPHAEEATTSTSRRHPTGSSTIRAVVATPPWARHGPPSPEIEPSLLPSDVTGRPSVSTTSAPPHAPSSSGESPVAATPASGLDARGWRFPLRSTLRRLSTVNSPLSPSREVGDDDDDARLRQVPVEAGTSYFPPNAARSLRLKIPRPEHTFTMAQSKTPGWSTPWAADSRWPHRPGQAHVRSTPSSSSDPDLLRGVGSEKNRRGAAWQQSKGIWKSFILANTYVPLLFRLLNISFTAAVLGVAVRIRGMEMQHGIVGAVGSSPLLAIIFSPLTLVHVMTAIYLEYFGRPLGLWRTSGKLTHTLVEVVFICLWSGSVAISAENYFTSPLLCVSPSSNYWWNHLPPYTLPLAAETGRHEGGVADSICDDQLAMLFLEVVGLALYNANLVISLFRIFEKVKTHTTMATSYA